MTNYPPQDIGSTRWRTALWWAAATACLVAPVAAALWTPRRSPVFYPLVGAFAAAAAFVGSVWNRQLPNRLSPSLLFTAIYPVALMLGLSIQNVTDGEFSVGVAMVVVVIGLAVGSASLLVRWRSPNPRRGLWWGGIIWAVVAVLTLPALGLGLFVAPEAVGYLVASRSAPDRHAG